MSRIIDLTGQKFGRLVVIKRINNDNCGRHRWLCRCDCKGKNEVIVRGDSLKSINTKSCGCLQIEKVTRHGHSNDKIYIVWKQMIQRCTNPNNKHWKDYGYREITVCDRWLGENGFIHFLEDIGEAPPGLTIERKKNNLGYCKENCKWATKKEQMRNTRDNLRIIHNGKTRLLIEWSEETGIPYGTLYTRIYKLNWTNRKSINNSSQKM